MKPTLNEIRFKVYADSSPAVEGSFTIDSILQGSFLGYHSIYYKEILNTFIDKLPGK